MPCILAHVCQIMELISVQVGLVIYLMPAPAQSATSSTQAAKQWLMLLHAIPMGFLWVQVAQ